MLRRHGLEALMPMLALEHISKAFAGRSALNDVSLSVPSGSTAALIGSSGSGKTTLLRITLRLITMDQGSVRLDGQPLSGFGPEAWADQIGYVPQDGGLFPHLTARQNVALVPGLRGWTPRRIAARIADLQRLVALEDALLGQFPHQLSGGQRQRVAIMRATMLDPPLLLLDEPMAALDPLLRSALQEDLKGIFQQLGKTVLIVTHDLGEAVYLASQLTLLHAGKVVQTGTYRDLLLRPADPFVTAFINAQRTLPDAASLQ
jgi:osmoprotectant transport system ATP-binding protein